jgi:hypothetical protein
MLGQAEVSMRKRKTTYPVARTSRRPPGPLATPEAPQVRPTVASIDLTAGAGRAGITNGSKVRIVGAGLYSGEIATVVSVPGGVIPSAMVRTESGGTRRVRTIDLEPIPGGETPPAG